MSATARPLLPLAVLLCAAIPVSAQTWRVPLVGPEGGGGYRAESVAFAPDGKSLVTAGWISDPVTGAARGELRFFDAATGELRKVLGGETTRYGNRGGDLAFSPDGKLLAAGGTIRQGPQGPSHAVTDIWDLAAGKVRATLRREQPVLFSVRFAPDGKTLATADLRGEITVWDVGKGRPLRRWNGGGGLHALYSADGKVIFSGDADNQVRVRDAANGKHLGTITLGSFRDGVQALARSGDGKRLAAAGWDAAKRTAAIEVWELGPPGADGVPRATRKARLFGHPDPSSNWVYSLAFSPDGKTLVSGAQDHAVFVWDVEKGEAVEPLAAHTDFVYSVAFSPDGKRLATLGRDALIVWPTRQPGGEGGAP